MIYNGTTEKYEERINPFNGLVLSYGGQQK